MLYSVPHVMPLELLAMTPPMVQADSLAGSGPSRRPYGASRRLTWRRTAPGPTRTRRPPSSTSIAPKWRRTSTSTLSVTDWPLRLVPPARKVSGDPSSAQTRITVATWAASVGATTACGVSR